VVPAKKIYVAGPYSSPDAATRRANVDRAVEVSIQLLLRGHYPFVPHLTHFVDEWAQLSGIELTWEDYIAWDVVWLRECDALFYLGRSKGADLERRIAEHLGIPVFYAIEDVPVGDGRTKVHEEVHHLLEDVVPAPEEGNA
jgi:hypothetical protein